MITIIHGDDLINSRNKLNELLTDKSGVTRIDARKTDTSTILTSLESQELFASERVIVMENALDNASVSQKTIPGLVAFQKDKNVTVILWQDKVIDKRLLTKLPLADIQSFSLPKHFYTFLDLCAPQNAAKLHTYLFSLYPQFSEEQVFYALIKRIRVLIMLKFGTAQEFSETQTMATWQLSRLAKQVSLWKGIQLTSFYKNLFDLEVRMKTGQLPLPLIHHLDMLFLSEL